MKRQRPELSELPNEVLVGQLFMVQPDPQKSPEDALAELDACHIGNFMVRRANAKSIEDVRRLNRTLRAVYRSLPPPIIAGDEEGGLVSEIAHLTTTAPSARALGQVDKPELTADVYESLGEKLKALGWNMALGPVLDVNSEHTNPVIGTRAFGSVADKVTEHGIAAIKGLKRAKIGSCAKHFPGHGATTADSHVSLPVVDADTATLGSRELRPFLRAIETEAPDMIMTAHVAFPALSGSGKPATFSREILRDLLRGEMGFKGVVITDAMEMAGVAGSHPPEQAALEALLAGVDVLLYAHDREMAKRAYAGVLQAVQTGTLARDRVEESVTRVFALRRRLAETRWVHEDAAWDLLDVIQDQSFYEAAMESMVLEGGERVFKNLRSRTGRKVAFLPRELNEHYRVPLDLVREQLEPAGFEICDLPGVLTGEDIQNAGRQATGAEVVVVGTASRGPMSAETRQLLDAVTAPSQTGAQSKLTVGVALLDPADVEHMTQASCRIKTFGFSGSQVWAMCQELLD